MLQPSQILQDEYIAEIPPAEILSRGLIDSLYDVEDDLERARLKALISARAKELKLEKEFKDIIKAFDSANQKLADEYTKANAQRNATVPIIFDSKGMPLKTIENMLIIIRNDSHFDNMKFNLLTYSPEKIVNGKAERWQDADDSAARNYIESKYNIYNPQKLDDALRIVFKEREYHPIKNIIDNLVWDGMERISTVLHKWLKCEDTEYSREVSRLIFSGGINRLYSPGCKFEDVPVLIGTKQGEGKSTFVRWLALQDEFFNEVCEIEGQKGIESLEGIWICEVAELLALTKTKDVEAVKGYISKQSDKYRRPFDKRVTEHKRQCVFIGTTNKEQFLTDKTGNRRWYPIKVHQSGYDLFDNKEQIQADILQCWAEAKAKYDKGQMKPYADRKLVEQIKEHQKHAMEDDYRDGLIEDYLRERSQVCVVELWKNALGNQYDKPSKKDSNEIALILQSTGQWERGASVRTESFGTQKVWNRVEITRENKSLFDDLPFSEEET